ELPRGAGALEEAAIELGRPAPGAMAVETEFAAGDVEALLDQLGEVAGAAHARAEARVVVAAATHLAHDADHVRSALGIVRGEPFLGENTRLRRQAQLHF